MKKASEPSIPKQRYFCTSCKYKFERQADIDFNNVCPYCGKKTVIKHVQSEAQKLIEDSEKWGFRDI